MATHSFEFIFGVLCVTGGALSRFVCWFLKTRRPEAMREADEGLAKVGLPGVLDTFSFAAVLMLLIGTALVAVSIIAYADF